MESHLTGRVSEKGSILHNAVGECPEAMVRLSGVEVRCLLDRGAQVSTIVESFYKEQLSGKIDLVNVKSYFRIYAANGEDIPFVGYVELDLVLNGNTLPDMGFLVVKDPEDRHMLERKKKVPIVIRSNIFRDLKKASLFDNLTDQWRQVVVMYEECVVKETEHFGPTHFVRIAGSKPLLVPANSLVVIMCNVKSAELEYSSVVEQNKAIVLPVGLRLGPTYVTVNRSGAVPIHVGNFSDRDVYLQPRTPIGILTPCITEPNVDVEQVGVNEIEVRTSVENKAGKTIVDRLLSKMEVGDNIDQVQLEKLKSVIEKHKSTFSMSEHDIGYCDFVEHKINTVDDAPIRVPHRRIPPHMWAEVRDYLRQALDTGIIQESSSPYTSAVVLVRKKNGGLRLCCDYRALNAKTRKDSYPLPRIDEALDVLNGAKFFCSLDLAHGFNQIPVAKDDVEKTAFRIGTGGLYEYVRMPFGLTGAPATFMRLMDKLFGDQNFQTILIYLDDILVFGSTFEETLERLDMVLSRLQQANL